jgi:glycogen synthase
MKIVFVGPYSPPHGGIQVHLVQLVKFLEGQGHLCYVIDLHKNMDGQSPNIASLRNAFEMPYYLIKKRDHKCHLHFGGNLHLRLLLLALFSGLLFHKRCAITIHSGGLPVWGRPKNRMRRLFLRFSFSFCGALICVNREIAGMFEDVGIKRERIRVVPPFAFAIDHVREALPDHINAFVTAKKPLFCNIGLLEPEYDLELLLGVFSSFVKHKPEAGLIMIGSGSLQSRLERRISDLGLSQRAMLTGDLLHSLTLNVLSSSDCYIRTSRYDGDCISLKEAIHLGVPAIATDTGIRPKEAILFSIGDEGGLLKRMMQVTNVQSKNKNISPGDDTSGLVEIERVLSCLF